MHHHAESLALEKKWDQALLVNMKALKIIRSLDSYVSGFEYLIFMHACVQYEGLLETTKVGKKKLCLCCILEGFSFLTLPYCILVWLCVSGCEDIVISCV